MSASITHLTAMHRSQPPFQHIVQLIQIKRFGDMLVHAGVLCQLHVLGKGLAAAASIPNNLVQAAVGIVLSVVLYTALAKVPEIHKAFWKGE